MGERRTSLYKRSFSSGKLVAICLFRLLYHFLCICVHGPKCARECIKVYVSVGVNKYTVTPFLSGSKPRPWAEGAIIKVQAASSLLLISSIQMQKRHWDWVALLFLSLCLVLKNLWLIQDLFKYHPCFAGFSIFWGEIVVVEEYVIYNNSNPLHSDQPVCFPVIKISDWKDRKSRWSFRGGLFYYLPPLKIICATCDLHSRDGGLQGWLAPAASSDKPAECLWAQLSSTAEILWEVKLNVLWWSRNLCFSYIRVLC